MLQDTDAKNILKTGVQIGLLENLEPALTDEQKASLCEIEKHIQAVRDFLRSFQNSDDFLRQSPDMLPYDVEEAIKAVRAFITHEKILSADQKKNLNNKVFPFEQLIELHQTEKGFLSDMAEQIHVEQFIQIAKRHLPGFFKNEPLFEKFLREAYSFRTSLKLSIHSLFDDEMNPNLSTAFECLERSIDAEEYKENINKFSLISANYNLFNKLLDDLKKKVKNDSEMVLLDLAGYQWIKPVQRGPRIKLFMESLVKITGTKEQRNEIRDDEGTIKAISPLAGHPIKSIWDKVMPNLLEINLFKDVLDKHPGFTPDVNKLFLLHKAHTELRALYVEMIAKSMDQELNKIQTQFNNKKVEPSQGIQAFIDEMKTLQNKISSLKISDPLPDLGEEIRKGIKKVKSEHPHFSLKEHATEFPRKMATFDKCHRKHLSEFNMVVHSQLQLDTIEKIKHNMLDAIIVKLQKSLERIQRKKARKPGDEVLNQKEAGLQQLLDTFRNMKQEISNNPQLIYKDKTEFSKKIKAALQEQKKATPLLTKGFFSQNRKCMEAIEKEAVRQDQRYIKAALENEKLCVDLKPLVDKFKIR